MKFFIARHSPLFMLAALCILLALVSEDFRGARNLQSVAGRTSEIGIIAIGELVVILTGGIDLSVGSVAALGGVVSGMTMNALHGAGWAGLDAGGGALSAAVGILAGCAVGFLCGLQSGLLVTKGRIPPFIATLGTMMYARGFCLILSGGKQIYGLPPAFFWIGGAKAWWVPVLLTLVFMCCFAIMLNHTRFGRALYATGGNLQAARLSGLPVDAQRTWAYILSGTLAGFAGVVLASRTSVAAPTAAEMYELDAIAACVIGGASLMGGEGGAVAALAGALIMTVLRNYCNLEDIDVYWQQVFVGALIVLLVYYDNYRKRKVGVLKE